MSMTPVSKIMEPIGDVSKSDALDSVALGFMCGLEIHQQLATGKLHSRLPTELYDFKSEEIPDECQIAFGLKVCPCSRFTSTPPSSIPKLLG